MTAKELAGAALVVGALVATAVVLIDDETKPLQSERVVGLSKLSVLRDGGKAYVVEVEVDAGAGRSRVELRTTAPGCVRRPKGAPVASCMRRERLSDGGLGAGRDFGDLNRFVVSEAVGAGCEAVACSVYAGEDAEAKEDDVVRKLLDAGALSRDGGGR